MEDDGDGLSQDEVSDEDVRRARDQEILRMYETHSADQIARHYGISRPTVYLITSKLGAVKKKGRPAKALEDRAISNDYVKVGGRFYRHACLDKRLDTVDVAKALSWSPQKVKAIVKGHHELTLTDMKIMAAFIGWTVSMLLEDI